LFIVAIQINSSQNLQSFSLFRVQSQCIDEYNYYGWNIKGSPDTAQKHDNISHIAFDSQISKSYSCNWSDDKPNTIFVVIKRIMLQRDPSFQNSDSQNKVEDNN